MAYPLRQVWAKEAEAERGNLRVQLSASTLARLLSRKQIAALELQCLDPDSRDQLRRLCLNTCLSDGNS